MPSTFCTLLKYTESHALAFFNSPMVHFYRNVFGHVPSTKVRDVTHMLKAIHAQENRKAAQEKAEAVIAHIRAQRLTPGCRTH